MQDAGQITEAEILNTMNHSNDGYYRSFVSLGHAYSYLIDSRINVFSNTNGKWAIAIERSGYNPRAGAILLEIFYYGNCLTDLETYNDRVTNVYDLLPVDDEQFQSTIDGEYLKPDAEFWMIRGDRVLLSHNEQEYLNAGITLSSFEFSEIKVEEAARFLLITHQASFRATDSELYRNIPSDLTKLMTIDEWHHRDFTLSNKPLVNDSDLKQAFVFNRERLDEAGIDFGQLKDMLNGQKALSESRNISEWENNRPGAYETWQMIAKAIIDNDDSYYQPTLKVNSHWSNWPDSGSL